MEFFENNLFKNQYLKDNVIINNESPNLSHINSKLYSFTDDK